MKIYQKPLLEKINLIQNQSISNDAPVTGYDWASAEEL